MASPTQGPAGYYVWEGSNEAVVIHLRLDVVDRLAAEVMRGLGLVPKRGAEVGGLLTGTMRPGLPTIVRIDDFVPVTCDYRRGPSYLFSEVDGAAFEESWGRLQPGASPSAYAVGYFRSHTRDGFSLETEDRELMDRFFPGAAHVALLIKPFATKVSVGGFFVRERGAFPESTPLEFPLRRRELLGEEPAPYRSLLEGRGEPRSREENQQGAFGFTASERAVSPEFIPAAEPAIKSRLHSGWVWLPLTFLFLLLGGALGYQLAVTLGARAASTTAQNFSLSLSVLKSGDNLSVTWSRQSPAIRTAQRGLLEIDDGGYTKPVALDAAQLKTGSLIYRNASKSVRFRLTVYPQARVSVVETFEWKQ